MLQRFLDKEETVEEFIRRNLGGEVFERLIEPFCSGVYAGDPSKLGMEAAFGKVNRELCSFMIFLAQIYALERNGGSLVGGSIKLMNERKKNPIPRDPTLPPKPAGQTVGSFKKGLKTLPEAIARQLPTQIKSNERSSIAKILFFRLEWRLLNVDKGEDDLFLLDYITPEGPVTVRSKTVALTIPSYIVAELLEERSVGIETKQIALFS